MAVLELKAQNFIAGESSADFVSDRGFSPSSHGLNLTKKRGVLHFIDSTTEIGSGTLVDDVIAGTYDLTYLGVDLHLLDASGNLYTLDGTTLTKKQTSASTFAEGTSDILQFNGYTYFTSQDSLHASAGSGLTDCERIWGVSFNGNYRHPIERVEDEIFVANGNVIYYLNNAGTTGTAFTLPTSQAVTSLRRHPDGRTLLAFTGDNLSNYSHTKGGGGKVYYCNPTTRDWEREVPVEAQVEGSRVVGGVIYTTYGQNFGYFDGSGLQPLKRLDTSTTTYSHAINNQEDNLLVRDGRFGLILGDLGAGNVWWRNFRNITANNLTTLFYQGDNKIIFCTADSKIFQIDYDNIGVNGDFYTNRYSFGTEVIVNRIEILHDTSNLAGTTRFFISYNDHTGTLSTIKDSTYINESTNKTRIDTPFQTDMLQLNVSPSNDDIGYYLIRIYYEPI